MASQPLQISRSEEIYVDRTIAPSKRDRFVSHPERGTLTGRIPNSTEALLANDNLHEIQAVDQACKAMLRSYWMHLHPLIRDGLLNQTRVILSPEEWEDETFLVSIDSYQTMLRALAELVPTKRPNLAVAENGNFLAAWRGKDAKVVLEFHANDRMRWLITNSVGQEMDRASGQTTVSMLPEIANVHGGRGVIDGTP